MFYPIHEPASFVQSFLMDIPVSKKYACSFLLQEKSNKGEMSLKEAIDDSENLTDFLMDFEEDE